MDRGNRHAVASAVVRDLHAVDAVAHRRRARRVAVARGTGYKHSIVVPLVAYVVASSHCHRQRRHRRRSVAVARALVAVGQLVVFIDMDRGNRHCRRVGTVRRRYRHLVRGVRAGCARSGCIAVGACAHACLLLQLVVVAVVPRHSVRVRAGDLHAQGGCGVILTVARIGSRDGVRRNLVHVDRHGLVVHQRAAAVRGHRQVVRRVGAGNARSRFVGVCAGRHACLCLQRVRAVAPGHRVGARAGDLHAQVIRIVVLAVRRRGHSRVRRACLVHVDRHRRCRCRFTLWIIFTCACCGNCERAGLCRTSAYNTGA